ncbi:MAG: hypothetical protein J6Y60_03305 [Treponema sp.]|nr:hypothetical protein [Treponema sp.]
MGVNRAMRRRQEREQLREWQRTGQAEKVRRISANGLGQKDLDDAYNDGYRKGYYAASKGFFKQMYAAISKTLYTAGNKPDDIINFLKDVDQRFAVMFDADDEIADVFNLIGVTINVERENVLDRIEVNP